MMDHRSLFGRHARIRAAGLGIIFAVLPCDALWGQAAWQASGTSILYAPTGVNVGIGTASPAQILDVETNASNVKVDAKFGSFFPVYLMNNWPSVGFNLYVGTDGIWRLGKGSTGSYGGLFNLNPNTGDLTYYTSGSANADGTTTLAAPVTFKQNGNVGIGTTVPAAKLDMNVPGGTTGFRIADTGTEVFTMKQNAISPWSIMLDGGTNRPIVLQANSTGNVGIGTTNPQYKLSVNGTVQTKEVIVNTGWADYVFAPDYRPTPLLDLAAYIKAHRRLPDIPSQAEVQKSGVGLGEMQVKLLAKIEELTLHMIQADERNNRLEEQNRKLQARVARLEAQAAGSGQH